MNQWATIYHIVTQGFQRGRVWLVVILLVSAVVLVVTAVFKFRQYQTAFILAGIIWVSLAGAMVYLFLHLSNQPYILRATLVGLEQRNKNAVLDGKAAGTYVQLDVHEAFYLTEMGRGENSPEKTGKLAFVTNVAIYQAVSDYTIGDELVVLGLGHNEVIGIVTSDHRLIMANGTHELVR